MFDTLPKTYNAADNWDWEQYVPYLEDLKNRELTPDSLDTWLLDWTRITHLIQEVGARRYVASNQNTEDKEAEAKLTAFFGEIVPKSTTYHDTLNRKLVESGLEPDDFAVPMRAIRSDIELYREENLPLIAQEQQLRNEYNKISGAQTVEWEGEEKTLPQLSPILQEKGRDRRENVWRLIQGRWQQDRDALNDLWGKLLKLRTQIAQNAGCDNYIDYNFKSRHRFDYTPDDARQFHAAVREVVVPALSAITGSQCKQLGLESMRPWDTQIDPYSDGMLKPFESSDDLLERVGTIFNTIDPTLGGYFQTMRDEKLLDLDNRKGKAPGGYQITFSLVRRPFIFMNTVGIHQDVVTLLHEGGHAFHAFSAAHLAYEQQLDIPSEFAEVASMAMELLGARYLRTEDGGFYDDRDAARARMKQMLRILSVWVQVAMVDAFQYWAYANLDEATDPDVCDAKWLELWQQYRPHIDICGLEDAIRSGWQQIIHIYNYPLYMLEYGLAQLGAVQVWANALNNQATALEQYKTALTLGGTVTLPELFTAAGAKLAFDAETMGQAVALVQKTFAELETELAS